MLAVHELEFAGGGKGNSAAGSAAEGFRGNALEDAHDVIVVDENDRRAVAVPELGERFLQLPLGDIEQVAVADLETVA